MRLVTWQLIITHPDPVGVRTNGQRKSTRPFHRAKVQAKRDYSYTVFPKIKFLPTNIFEVRVQPRKFNRENFVLTQK